MAATEYEYEFTDRYQALGLSEPHLLTACLDCEGMGCYPVRERSRELTLYELQEISRQRAENGPEQDGWYVIRCNHCHGTRKVPLLRSIARVPWWIWKGITFLYHTRGDEYVTFRDRWNIAFRLP